MTLSQLKNEGEVDLDDLDLKTTDFENTLNVYQDDRANWHYNLNMTAKVQVDSSLLKTYKCTCDCHWPIISYNIYGTTRLAWLLMQLNDINISNVFHPILAGDEVKYIDKSYVRTIVNSLQDYNAS